MFLSVVLLYRILSRQSPLQFANVLQSTARSEVEIILRHPMNFDSFLQVTSFLSKNNHTHLILERMR